MARLPTTSVNSNGGQLAELGPVDGRAVAQAQVRLRAERLHEVDRREEVGVLMFSAVMRALEQAERVEGVDDLLEALDARAGDQAACAPTARCRPCRSRRWSSGRRRRRRPAASPR